MSAAPSPAQTSAARRMLYFAVDGSPPRLVDALCKHDGAYAINCWARPFAPDLSALFSPPHDPGRIKLQAIAVRSLEAPNAPPEYLHLFYSVMPALHPNGFALGTLGLHHPENRIFWRGDMVLARWFGREHGYGHIDVPEMARLIAAVERMLLQAWLERRLEQYLEEDRSWLSTTPLRLQRYQTLREEIRELDAYRTHRVLLLPSDGSEPRNIPLVFSEEGARAIHSFLQRAPDLWHVFGPAIATTRMQMLVSPHPHHNIPGLITEYHVFYNLSPTLPVNLSAMQIATGADDPPGGRLAWRGDIVIARSEGASGYADTGADALPVIQAGLQRLWETQALEASVQADRDFLAERAASGPDRLELPRHAMLREHIAEIDAHLGK